MTRALPATLLLLAACSPPPSGTACRASVVATPDALIGRTGVEREVEFKIDTPEGCPGPSSAEVTVLDPSGDIVPSTSELTGLTGRVRFTPVIGGSHHVTARFQPNKGTGQQEVLVARDRSAEPGLFLPQGTLSLIEGLELNDAGFLITPSRNLMRVQPDSGVTLVQTYSAGTVLVPAGSVLWVDGSRVSRQVPAGDVYVDMPDASIAFSPTVIFATENDATLANFSGIRQVSPANGGFDVRTVPGSLGAGDHHRVGSRLFSLETTQECALDLNDGGTQCLSYGSANFQTYLGGDSRGFWLQLGSLSGATLAFHGEGLGQQVTATLPRGTEISTRAGRPAAFPIATVDDPPNGSVELVATFENGRIGFEYWGPSVVSATATTVVTPVSSGGLVVHRR